MKINKLSKLISSPVIQKGILFFFVFLLIYICVPATCFYIVENVILNQEEWTYFTCLYFSIISLSTVGFGDYVPQGLIDGNSDGNDQKEYRSTLPPIWQYVYLIFIFIWIFAGLITMKLCLELMSDSLKFLYHDGKRKLHHTAKCAREKETEVVNAIKSTISRVSSFSNLRDLTIGATNSNTNFATNNTTTTNNTSFKGFLTPTNRSSLMHTDFSAYDSSSKNNINSSTSIRPRSSSLKSLKSLKNSSNNSRIAGTFNNVIPKGVYNALQSVVKKYESNLELNESRRSELGNSKETVNTNVTNGTKRNSLVSKSSSFRERVQMKNYKLGRFGKITSYGGRKTGFMNGDGRGLSKEV